MVAEPHTEPPSGAPLPLAPDLQHATGGDPVAVNRRQTLRIGVGGPVGSGKTALIAELCRRLAGGLQLAVVTNDIFTTEDAEALRRAGVLDPARIVAVETGCCPHTAIRDDIAANLDAVEGLEARYGDLDVVLVESGGDNLTAIFSQALVDLQIFVIDVAAGDKVPRKGGPGVTTADLLVINKTDLAPLVGADLLVMDRDARALRADVTLAEGAALVWLDELVLGRSHETAGAVTSTLRVTRDGAPLIHHSVSTHTPGWRGPAVTAGARAVGTILHVGPSAVPLAEMARPGRCMTRLAADVVFRDSSWRGPGLCSPAPGSDLRQ